MLCFLPCNAMLCSETAQCGILLRPTIAFDFFLLSISRFLILTFCFFFFFQLQNIGRENVLRCQMRPGADLCATSCPLLQIYSVLCVISQYQEYMAGRGTAADDYEYGVSILRVSQRKQDRDKRRKVKCTTNCNCRNR